MLSAACHFPNISDAEDKDRDVPRGLVQSRIGFDRAGATYADAYGRSICPSCSRHIFIGFPFCRAAGSSADGVF